MLTESPYLRETSKASKSHSRIGNSPPSVITTDKQTIAHEAQVMSVLCRISILLGLLTGALSAFFAFVREFTRPSFSSAVRTAELVR